MQMTITHAAAKGWSHDLISYTIRSCRRWLPHSIEKKRQVALRQEVLMQRKDAVPELSQGSSVFRRMRSLLSKRPVPCSLRSRPRKNSLTNGEPPRRTSTICAAKDGIRLTSSHQTKMDVQNSHRLYSGGYSDLRFTQVMSSPWTGPPRSER